VDIDGGLLAPPGATSAFVAWLVTVPADDPRPEEWAADAVQAPGSRSGRGGEESRYAEARGCGDDDLGPAAPGRARTRERRAQSRESRAGGLYRGGTRRGGSLESSTWLDGRLRGWIALAAAGLAISVVVVLLAWPR
jgi:hypothetical protein